MNQKTNDMADTTDDIFYDKEPETPPNHTGHASKVFAIHMGVLLVVSILIGIFWSMDAMWIFGGLCGLWMAAWHWIALVKAAQKDKECWDER